MADFEAPSFSLGFDFDLDSNPSIVNRAPEPSANRCSKPLQDANNDEEFRPEFQCVNPDPDPPRVLKRLKRGLSSEAKKESEKICLDVDDDIEEFSSPEHSPRGWSLPTGFHSACSSSKLPIRGALTTQLAGQRKRRTTSTANAPASASLETSSKKFEIPKLTISPLRRFQLLDSDSDSNSKDPSSVSEENNHVNNKVNSSSKTTELSSQQHDSASDQKRVNTPGTQRKIEDLWKDFCPKKSFCIPTTALDEVCEEYFSSVKDRGTDQKAAFNISLNDANICSNNKNIAKSVEHQPNTGDTIPPAHHYYFHDDPRVRNLVRSRLQYFSPLGIEIGRSNEQSSTVIDYLSQFSNKEGKQPPSATQNVDRGSTRSQKKSRGSNFEQVSHSSWVNPRECASVPKDAGKRRVSANSQSAGHWYTGSDGRKVYVTKTGQELTGRNAYRHYKKDSGGGFRKSKKKKQTARQTASRKKRS
ncbi:hypothetical protein RJ641_000370 [Dillenia turbinata]|uniref:Uncharacterized protein n=1 Tax=Dillenia turbinata TaxID=194707 RepID=A0AAN8WEI4_9MAGN